MNFLNKNSNISLTKRTKSGDKDKYQTIINSKIQNNTKYLSYFQSPKKGEDLLFIKKKFQKPKKNSGEKIKSEISNNINISNNNSSSSYINFMSPINKNYFNKKQNFALAKFLKNQLILNSIDTSYAKSKEKERDKGLLYNSNENIISANDSARINNKNLQNNNNNFMMNNKKTNKTNVLNTFNKNASDLLYNNHHRIENNNKKINTKDLSMKLGKNSFKFNFLNNLSTNNKHFYKTKLYSIKGVVKNKKINKNISNSNQNLLSNTMFESNNKSHIHNNINYYENYIKAVVLNKSNKYSINKSISTNLSHINNSKKANHNMTFNQNTINGVANSTRDQNLNTTNNKSLYISSAIQSPKVNISKTTKNSPKSSLVNINNKKIKGHVKNKSISIITKSDVSLLFKNNNNNSNIKTNKINYNNMNYTTLNDNGNLNLYTNNGHHYKYSQIFNNNKKLSLIDIENNNGKISSPYNVYYKKKTQPNSTENSFI